MKKTLSKTSSKNISIQQFRIQILFKYKEKDLKALLSSLTNWIAKLTKHKTKANASAKGKTLIIAVLKAENKLVRLLVTKFPQYHSKIKLPTVPYVIHLLMKQRAVVGHKHKRTKSSKSVAAKAHSKTHSKVHLTSKTRSNSRSHSNKRKKTKK